MALGKSLPLLVGKKIKASIVEFFDVFGGLFVQFRLSACRGESIRADAEPYAASDGLPARNNRAGCHGVPLSK
jgi:hypothetical protein